ncbi:alpha/beta fold hydrolase [Amycolatopsis sp., V23-08]|uniref:Alpha/beta fold hydrolase n=1 Tax=Amycolatopsis heterodermiae TaxID=3110235 RepID=A0ABU5R838_9PSEU|nr:alpha/beta fold hydrolase [Amycolatopsis sp., V23-08]MEA5362313.1 alpha/beta fold hydrolase [Amycolatopsis sp., V23-08]
MKNRVVAVTSAALLSLTALTACGEVAVSSKTQPSVVKTADLSPCHVPEMPTARCGTIEVPLDRAHPDAGTTPIGFALVPHTDQSGPAVGTVVTNPGGPGTGAIDLTGHYYADGLKPILAKRDLLLVDPRGVGRSGAIRCPALEDLTRIFQDVDHQRAAIGECGRQLGAKAAYYGTAAAADDFEDVRAALGIDRLDLLGDSYGTYLMTTFVARHPEHVDSVVLSGAFPVNTSNDPSGAVAIDAVRRGVGLVCERTGSCSGDVVLRDLGELATQLRKKAVSMDVDYQGKTHDVVLDEWQLAGTVGKIYSGAADVETKVALAKAVAAAHAGDLNPVQDLVRAHLVSKADTYALGESMVSEAMSWATTCHDYQHDFKLTDDVAIRKADFGKAVAGADKAAFAPFSPQAWLTRDDYDAGLCLDWPADPTAGAPVAPGTRLADVPVLVLAGDLDANTSSVSGRETAAQFPRAKFVEVKDAGHTATLAPEGAKLEMDFITQNDL